MFHKTDYISRDRTQKNMRDASTARYCRSISAGLQGKNDGKAHMLIIYRVKLVALPAAINDAYQKVLPKRKEKLFEEEKEQVETEIPADLFEGQGV